MVAVCCCSGSDQYCDGTTEDARSGFGSKRWQDSFSDEVLDEKALVAREACVDDVEIPSENQRVPEKKDSSSFEAAFLSAYPSEESNINSVLQHDSVGVGGSSSLSILVAGSTPSGTAIQQPMSATSEDTVSVVASTLPAIPSQQPLEVDRHFTSSRTAGAERGGGYGSEAENRVSALQVVRKYLSSGPTSLNSSVAHMQEFRAEIRRGGRPLGMSLVCIDEETFVVMAVGRGPVEDWNNSGAGHIIVPDQLIVAVNGIEGSAKDMLKEMRTSDVLELRIRDPEAPKEGVPKLIGHVGGAAVGFPRFSSRDARPGGASDPQAVDKTFSAALAAMPRPRLPAALVSPPD